MGASKEQPHWMPSEFETSANAGGQSVGKAYSGSSVLDLTPTGTLTSLTMSIKGEQANGKGMNDGIINLACEAPKTSFQEISPIFFSNLQNQSCLKASSLYMLTS